MDAFNPENTKPSRISRTRKRRWRPSLISDLIKSGLTDCCRLGHDLRAVTHLTVGLENLFSIGVNTPRTFAVFLCLSYCAALCRHFTMAGCFGQSSDWLASNTQFLKPNSIRRQSLEKLDRWFTSLSIGVTA